jgi:hypothetical protein
MITCINQDQEVNMPAWVTDINAFRRWADSDDLPEGVRVWWLKGKVWLDMSMEQIFTHVDVKTEIAGVLRRLAKAERLGRVLSEGAFLSNFAADISGKPD